MSDIIPLLAFAGTRPGEPLALASVVRTRGSTYRRPGARMLIAANGESTGAVSGGCLERDVMEHAREVIRDGEARLLTYDTRLTLGCNGVVEILVERVPGPGGDVLSGLRQRMAKREAGVLATVLVAGTGQALGSYILSRPEFRSEWMADAQAVLQAGRSARRSYDDGCMEVFFGYIPPPIRLLVLGTGYDALPLLRLGGELGWEVVVVGYSGDDAIRAGADAAQEIIISHPSELANSFKPDAFTAAVVMTHHFGRDLAFLHALLPIGLPYLGLLGPRKRREQLLAALAEQGCVPEEASLAALRSPAGLDLGGDTPEEIALSIIAEVRAVLAGRGGGSLRERRGGIHDDTPWPKPGRDSRSLRPDSTCVSA